MPQITKIIIAKNEPDFFRNLTYGGIQKWIDDDPKAPDARAQADDGMTLIFERKTPNDFLNTLKEERLFPQLARMTELRDAQQRAGEPITSWAYLIITGSFLPGADGKVTADGRTTGWGLASVMGAILSIQELGVFVVFANGDMDYEDCILRIGKRSRDPQTKILAPRPAKTLGPKIDFLTGISGIGVEHAQNILEWSNDNVADALTGMTDLEIESPIGLALRRRIRNLIGLCNGENFQKVGTQITEPITQGERQR